MSEAAALYAAAVLGDLATVTSLLATAAGRAAIDVPDEDGWTALIQAAAKGHTPVVEALLSAGVCRALKRNLEAAATFRSSPPNFGSNVRSLSCQGTAMSRSECSREQETMVTFTARDVLGFSYHRLGQGLDPNK